MNIKPLKTYNEIAKSHDAFLELRPHLVDKEKFIAQVMGQQKEGYEIIAIEHNNEIVACIGFRIITTLTWGKILYIDDFVTKEKDRGKGYGKILLDHVTQIGRDRSCDQIHLDSGYARHAAHKFYLKQGFEFHCHHLALRLK